MKIVKKQLTDLKRPEKNLRLHTDKQLVEFKRSIEMFGQIRPIVIDENNVMLAGNGLYEALLQMGQAEADCHIIKGLTEQQKKKLMLADNRTKLDGKVPVVIVNHTEEAEDMYGTVTHNRARGTHLLEPMKAIVKKLIDDGKPVSEISKQLGMKPEEVFRLSDFTKEDFLAMMTKTVKDYSRAEALVKI